jgi:hypothetical protein
MFGHDWLVFIVLVKPCRTHVFDDRCCPPHMMDHQNIYPKIVFAKLNITWQQSNMLTHLTIINYKILQTLRITISIMLTII